jgi:flagellar basal-body rod protein FlgB
MDFNQIPIFSVIKKRMEWLTERQEVIATNISNSDTPGYKPKDLRPFEFDDLVRRQKSALNMRSEDPGHMEGQRKRITEYASEETHKPFETAPQGNAVVLEEQMMKVAETSAKHKLTSELYKKHLNMFRMALGKR